MIEIKLFICMEKNFTEKQDSINKRCLIVKKKDLKIDYISYRLFQSSKYL